MESVKQRAQAIMDRYTQNGFCAGSSLLVLQHGEEKLYAQSGWADRESQIPVQRDTLFRLYSMSKPITGCAAMILLERGIIDLYEPVSQYLPGFKNCMVRGRGTPEPVSRPVRIRDLLSMTSGLPYGDEETQAGKGALSLFAEIGRRLHSETPMTTVEIANRMGENGLSFQPGERWMYGTSADVMGAVIEQASGMRFGEFLQKELFEPLGMKDTAFYVPEEKRARLTKVYEETENGAVPIHTEHLGVCCEQNSAPAFESGGAGLVSTLDDYAQFARMLRNGGRLGETVILQPSTVRFFTAGSLEPWQEASFTSQFDGLTGFTYGNFMRVMKDPGRAFVNAGRGSYGWDGWLGPYFANDPENDLTILMMLQRKDSGTVSMTRELINLITAAFGR